MTTVNPEISTRHEATRITEQEHGRTSVLVRIAQAAEHIGIRPILLPLGKSLKETRSHGRDDVSGRYGIDSDPMLAPLSCEIASELDHTRFGGVIGSVRGAGVSIPQLTSRRGRKRKPTGKSTPG